MCFNQIKSVVEYPDANDYLDEHGAFDELEFGNALLMYKLFRPPCVTLPSNKKRTCTCKQKGIKMKDGNILFDKPSESYRWCHYILLPHNNNEAWQDPTFQKEFWLHFHIPYEKFKELIMQMKDGQHFQCWMSPDATSWAPSPIELLTLVMLHYLGHGWTFDDLQEAMFINSETLHQFFHRFVNMVARFCIPCMLSSQQPKRWLNTCKSTCLLVLLDVLAQLTSHTYQSTCAGTIYGRCTWGLRWKMLLAPTIWQQTIAVKYFIQQKVILHDGMTEPLSNLIFLFQVFKKGTFWAIQHSNCLRKTEMASL